MLCVLCGKSESQIRRLVEEADKENERGTINVSDKLRTFIRQTKVKKESKVLVHWVN